MIRGERDNFLEYRTSPINTIHQGGYNINVRILLYNRADISFCEKNGASPIFVACQYKHHDVVELLLSCGATINICKRNGASLFFVSCEKVYNKTVKPLLGQKSHVNQCKSPLCGLLKWTRQHCSSFNTTQSRH